MKYTKSLLSTKNVSYSMDHFILILNNLEKIILKKIFVHYFLKNVTSLVKYNIFSTKKLGNLFILFLGSMSIKSLLNKLSIFSELFYFILKNFESESNECFHLTFLSKVIPIFRNGTHFSFDFVNLFLDKITKVFKNIRETCVKSLILIIYRLQSTGGDRDFSFLILYRIILIFIKKKNFRIFSKLLRLDWASLGILFKTRKKECELFQKTMSLKQKILFKLNSINERNLMKENSDKNCYLPSQNDGDFLLAFYNLLIANSDAWIKRDHLRGIEKFYEKFNRINETKNFFNKKINLQNITVYHGNRRCYDFYFNMIVKFKKCLRCIEKLHSLENEKKILLIFVLENRILKKKNFVSIFFKNTFNILSGSYFSKNQKPFLLDSRIMTTGLLRFIIDLNLEKSLEYISQRFLFSKNTSDFFNNPIIIGLYIKSKIYKESSGKHDDNLLFQFRSKLACLTLFYSDFFKNKLNLFSLRKMIAFEKLHEIKYDNEFYSNSYGDLDVDSANIKSFNLIRKISNKAILYNLKFMLGITRKDENEITLIGHFLERWLLNLLKKRNMKQDRKLNRLCAKKIFAQKSKQKSKLLMIRKKFLLLKWNHENRLLFPKSGFFDCLVNNRNTQYIVFIKYIFKNSNFSKKKNSGFKNLLGESLLKYIRYLNNYLKNWYGELFVNNLKEMINKKSAIFGQTDHFVFRKKKSIFFSKDDYHVKSNFNKD
jgi:hypothetical protein